MKRFTQTDAATGRVTLTSEAEQKGIQKVIERLARYEEIGSATDFKIYKQEAAKFAGFRKEIGSKLDALNVKCNNLARDAMVYKTEAFQIKMLALAMETDRLKEKYDAAGEEKEDKDIWLEAVHNIIEKFKTIDFSQVEQTMALIETMAGSLDKKDGDDNGSSVED